VGAAETTFRENVSVSLGTIVSRPTLSRRLTVGSGKSNWPTWLPLVPDRVLEEPGDERRVEVSQIHLAGLLPGAPLDEHQQQTPGVAVGSHGVGAGLALVD
jgi:hypothetical protein